MAKKFTSASLSDEELEDLDPWLQDNLGELDEGSFWIIERSEKTGKVEAVMMDENFTSKSRRTIPDEAISTQDPAQDSFEEENPAYRSSKPVKTWKESWGRKPPAETDQEGERPLRKFESRGPDGKIWKESGYSATDAEWAEDTKPHPKDAANRFGRKNKDFSRPDNVEEARAKSRGETYTPPPLRKPKFAEPKEDRPAYKPRFAEPKREAYKPRFAEPVAEVEEPEVDLPQVVDPAAKKTRRKTRVTQPSRSIAAFDKFDAEKSSYDTLSQDGKISRTAPVVEAEAPAVEETPVAEPAKKDRKNIFQRAGGKVAAVARGAKDAFAGFDPTFSEETYVPEWINDPDVGVSEPGLLESSSRTMGLDRLRQNKNKKSGTATLGKVEYWTDPNDGTTFVREVDSDEDELPAEVDMTGAAQPEQDLGTVLGRSREENFKLMKPKDVKDEDKEGRPWWVGSPPKGFKVIEGSSRDMQMAQEKAKLQASDEAPEGFDRSFSAGSSEWHNSFDSYTGIGIMPVDRTQEGNMYKFRMLVPTGVISKDEEKKSPKLR